MTPPDHGADGLSDCAKYHALKLVEHGYRAVIIVIAYPRRCRTEFLQD